MVDYLRDGGLLAASALDGACAAPFAAPPGREVMMVRIELLYVDDCPGWQAMASQLDQLAGELGFEWVAVRISSWEQAQARQFHGSPSLHIDGLDPFAAPGAGVGLACRIYPTTSGSAGTPGIDALRHVLAGARDAGRPSG